MSNRKTRRNAKNSGKDAEEITLALPDRNAALPAQTLYQLAAERQSGLFKDVLKNASEPDIITTTINADRILSHDDSEHLIDNDSADYLLTVLLYAISLTLVHLTFNIFVHQQYMQDIDWWQVTSKSATAFPILFALLYLCHSRASTIWMQFLLAIGGALAGCYIVHASNRYSYFAVMQRMPPLGALWIWSVVELDVKFAAVSVAAVGIFFVAGGYTLR